MYLLRWPAVEGDGWVGTGHYQPGCIRMRNCTGSFSSQLLLQSSYVSLIKMGFITNTVCTQLRLSRCILHMVIEEELCLVSCEHWREAQTSDVHTGLIVEVTTTSPGTLRSSPLWGACPCWSWIVHFGGEGPTLAHIYEQNHLSWSRTKQIQIPFLYFGAVRATALLFVVCCHSDGVSLEQFWVEIWHLELKWVLSIQMNTRSIAFQYKTFFSQ